MRLSKFLRAYRVRLIIGSSVSSIGSGVGGFGSWLDSAPDRVVACFRFRYKSLIAVRIDKLVSTGGNGRVDASKRREQGRGPAAMFD